MAPSPRPAGGGGGRRPTWLPHGHSCPVGLPGGNPCRTGLLALPSRPPVPVLQPPASGPHRRLSSPGAGRATHSGRAGTQPRKVASSRSPGPAPSLRTTPSCEDAEAGCWGGWPLSSSLYPDWEELSPPQATMRPQPIQGLGGFTARVRVTGPGPDMWFSLTLGVSVGRFHVRLRFESVDSGSRQPSSLWVGLTQSDDGLNPAK